MFKKGQSGNPKGRRPEDSSEIRDLARKYCPEAIARLVEWMRSDNPKASVQASNALLDRGWGKPRQEIDHEVSGKDGVPLQALINIGRKPEHK